MEYKGYKFDRMEFAGSLGDLGVLLPLSIGLIAIAGLNATVVLVGAGLLYIATGLYYKLPVPVQPLKVVAAIAIAYPDKATPEVIAATGLTFGAFLLILGWTGLIDWVAKFFTRPVIRGIQVGLGLLLITRGVGFMTKTALFSSAGAGHEVVLWGIPVNVLIGIAGAAATLLLLSSRRFPAALVVVMAGILFGAAFLFRQGIEFSAGPVPVKAYMPAGEDFLTALFLLVIPQIPLSLGNAIIGMSDTCCAFFGEGKQTARATNRGFATSMGLANLAVGAFAGMPMCHGAGGLAAHYRFGARTGGSNIMIGVVFLVLGLAFGKMSLTLLSIIPNGILGALLLFAGLELTILIKDVKEPGEIFIVFLITGIALATTNMGIAFFVGILVEALMKRGRVSL